MNYRCPICEMYAARVFLRRENVPVHQNFLFDNAHEAISIARGTLNIAICHNCGFVFNTDFDAGLLSYDEKYENTQSYSPVFEKYLDDSVNYLVHQRGVHNRRVIEVGCGKGHFLQKLVEHGDNSGTGFDPSYIGPLEKLAGRLRFRKEFYDEAAADLPADVIVCRHVIEHIGNPLRVLGAIRQALIISPHAEVFFETPDVEWILKNQVIWDFFYEHCSYFSAPSIRLAFQKSAFLVDNISKVFGNQYFWVEARPTLESNLFSPTDIDRLTGLAQHFSEVDSKLFSLWTERLINLHSQGNIAVWGAGAKGVTFANLFDPEKNLISYIIDINPQKQNKFLPGTGHPIVGYHELLQKNIRSVIILNPNYRQEIEDLLGHLGVERIMLHEFISGV